MDSFIIIYNGESDFIIVYTKEQVKDQIEALIKDGYAKDDIALYGCKELPFEITLKNIDIEITE